MARINNQLIILGIDTSCDETAAAITIGRRVLSNVIWSQIEIHQPWGGVVPDLARRAHHKHINEVINNAIKRANIASKRLGLRKKISLSNIDAIAVTQGPGLAIALEVGIKKAKKLAKKYQKPLIAINHMEGHLLSAFALNSLGKGPFTKAKPRFPLLGLLVSGGHTQLVLMKDFGQYKLIGETLDDAAGEAFDKVAKMLKLGYPGGPIIAKLAKEGNPKRFELPIPMAKDHSLNFSFSGLKTACFYQLQKIPEEKQDKKFFQDFAASFENALVKSIGIKLKKAIERYRPKQLVLGGGVINNLALRQEARKITKKFHLSLFIPYSKLLFTDNAAMIAVTGSYKAQENQFVKNLAKLDRKPNLSF